MSKIPDFNTDLKKMQVLADKTFKKEFKDIGEQMVSKSKAIAPKKTGEFANSIKGKFKIDDDGVVSYIAYPTGRKLNNLKWGILENGTGNRFRIYKDKSKNQRFRSPKTTGKFGSKKGIQKSTFTNIQEEYGKILDTKLQKAMKGIKI